MGSNPLVFIQDIRRTLSTQRNFSSVNKSDQHDEIDSQISLTENIWNYKISVDFIAGCLGGCAGVLISHPLDTVKVHLQTQNPHNPKYRGTFHCLRVLFSEEKFRGIYKGMTSPLTGLAFVNAIVFGIYGNIQRLVDNPNSIGSYALAGGLAGFFQSFISSPVELAKIQMQLQDTKSSMKFACPLDCLVHIYRFDGLRGIMRGLLMTNFRDIPGFTVYFASYEYLMSLISTPPIIYSLFAGGMAGISSWLVSYPFDVIKSCIQGDNISNPRFSNHMDVIRQGYRSKGLSFFFRGLISTMIRSFPMNAACFVVATKFIEWMDASAISSVNYDHSYNIKDLIISTGNYKPHYTRSITTQNITHSYHQQSLFTQQLRFQTFGTFSDAICNQEVSQLANEITYSNVNISNDNKNLKNKDIIAENSVNSESLFNC